MVYWCTNERGVSRSNKVGKVAKRPAKCGPLFRLSGQQKQQKGKVYFGPPTIAKVRFCPSTLKPDKQAPQLLKPRRFSPSTVLSGGFATVPHRFISAESLKNRSKSQKKSNFV
jgi:hypothetical protein